MGESLLILYIIGSGKRPETWATLVICLRQVKLNDLADIIEAEYSESGDIGDTPGSELSIIILYIYT